MTYLKTNNNEFKLILKYILCLIPMYLYGIYKNGYLLYNSNLIEFSEIFKLIYLLIIGIVIYFIVSLIFKKRIDYSIISIFVIPLFMPISINYLLYSICIFIILCIYNILNKYININLSIITILIIILILYLMKTLNYLNIGEQNNIYSLGLFDILMGRNPGGLGSSSIVIALIVMLLLSITNYYKYTISISSILTIILLSIIFKNYNILLYGTCISAIILIGTDSYSTPIFRNYQVIYGIILGILIFILTKYIYYEGVFIAIFLCNIIFEVITKLSKKAI